MKIRSSIYLEQEDLEELRLIAKKEDLSICQIIRKIIAEFLKAKKSLDKV